MPGSKIRLEPTPAQLFIYGIIVTLLVFVADSKDALLAMALINGVPGFLLGARRYPFLTLLVVIGIWGTFLNALLLVNTGEPVFSIGPLVVREGAVNATMIIGLRFITLGGVSLLYVSQIKPRESLKSLEAELGLPKGIAFSIAFALRLLKLGEQDIREILQMRRQRGARRIPVTPSDYESLMMPLLSLMLERARWVGIAAELRGFALRENAKRTFVPTLGLTVLVLMLCIQAYLIVLYG